MYITSIYLRNFRNIKEAEICFDPNLNIFVGKNAQGKTNLCEAISVCLGGSFRRVRFSQFVPADDPKAEVLVRLKFRDDITERENIINYTICKNNVEIKYNDIKMKDAAELDGVMKYVVFIPEHLNLIKGVPEGRRDYLDSVAMMQTPVHYKKLSRYNKALKNKNNILSGINFGDDLSKIIPQTESWNTVLAAEGLNVTYGRLKYFSQLEDLASQLYKELSGGENLTLKYYSSIFDTTELKCEEINGLYNEYLDRLNDSFKRELKMRYTVLGVHRDDMNLYINGNEVKEFGSQGQQRSTALALKLAEAEIIRRKEETPIMILDDVLSELDEHRQHFILNHIVNSQVFITCCNINDVKELASGKVWNVKDGVFTEE